jgi:hypothetical protein
VVKRGSVAKHSFLQHPLPRASTQIPQRNKSALLKGGSPHMRQPRRLAPAMERWISTTCRTLPCPPYSSTLVSLTSSQPCKVGCPTRVLRHVWYVGGLHCSPHVLKDASLVARHELELPHIADSLLQCARDGETWPDPGCTGLRSTSWRQSTQPEPAML